MNRHLLSSNLKIKPINARDLVLLRRPIQFGISHIKIDGFFCESKGKLFTTGIHMTSYHYPKHINNFLFTRH